MCYLQRLEESFSPTYQAYSAECSLNSLKILLKMAPFWWSAMMRTSCQRLRSGWLTHPEVIFGVYISCARMACFSASHSSDVPVREGTHDGFSSVSPGPLPSPSELYSGLWARETQWKDLSTEAWNSQVLVWALPFISCVAMGISFPVLGSSLSICNVTVRQDAFRGPSGQ